MKEDFGFPFGCVAAVAAVIVANLAGATGHPWYALVTLGAVVLFAARRSSFAAATGVAVVAWALDTGFVLGRLGELTFDAPAALAALVLASTLVTGLLTRAVSTAQSRVSTLQVRQPTVRVREFAGRVLRVP
ncbi:hypothetical protein [Amycolatopsis sp. MtRt-6]|uniref:hypothetical protein n=1 Tax=Amycolatopsis sp. MtRt-6 TaxID=2792782 RepID=UPI001A8EEBA5|nr:hypothetical protein [Amycolatopsis sp. MtRt-6]